MLMTDRDRRICEKYSKRDEVGHVHCLECPLVRYGIERNKDWFCGDAERRTDEFD